MDVYDVSSLCGNERCAENEPRRAQRNFDGFGDSVRSGLNPEWRKMRRKSGEQGSAAVAFALATFLVIFTIVTVYLFLAKIWWFPPAISDFGAQIDAQFHRTLIITVIVFVAAQIGLALAIFRSRDRGQKVSFFEGNSAMELIWTLATVIMFVGLGLYGEHASAEACF